MSTITAILEADPDGTLHLPLPPELRGGKVRVEATLASAAEEPDDAPKAKGFGAFPGIWIAPDFDAPLEDFDELRPPPVATPEMLRRRKEAADALRAMGGLKDVIPDPVEWQRELREDRELPGRE